MQFPFLHGGIGDFRNFFNGHSYLSEGYRGIFRNNPFSYFVEFGRSSGVGGGSRGGGLKYVN